MDTDKKKQRLATILKWAGGLVGAAIISPVIFLAVKGLVGLGLAALTGFLILRLSPVVSMKVSNLVVKMIVHEAEKNPIETMENLLIEKTEELQTRDQQIVAFETSVRDYDGKAAQFKKDYPDEAASFQEISAKMHEGLGQRKRRQKEAREELAELERRIEKGKALYKMSMAALEVTAMSKTAEAEVYQKIKENVALDAIASSLNRAFANLSMAIDQDSDVIAPSERVAIEEVESVAITSKRKS